MRDAFLRKVRVSSPQEAMRNSLRSALQRNVVYALNVSVHQRKAFRETWGELIAVAARKYFGPVTDAHHCRNIAKIADVLSTRHASVLAGGRMRFGTSQKALNLYLKFLWRLGMLQAPPHCPVDRVVLRAAGISGSWTKSDSEVEYMVWIEGIRKVAGQATLADWEYDVWT